MSDGRSSREHVRRLRRREGIHSAPSALARRVLVIPARNEQPRIADVLLRVHQTDIDWDVVVVDDGSDDRTVEVAGRAGARVLRHPFNLGYAAALQTGYKYAHRCGAATVAQMDADGQHDAADLPRLIDAVESGAADLVIGSRFLDAGAYDMGLARSAGRRVLQAVGRCMGLRVTDPTSGFQAMNRKTLAVYVSNVFPTDYADLDVLLLANRLGIRIVELPVRMAPSPRASSIHRGLGPVYYLYRTALSIWAGTAGLRHSLDGSSHTDDG